MNANLLRSANEVILDQKMLVNVIRLRVRQLAQGHRPLVEFTPGMGLADVALTEVINKKLTFELAPILPPGTASENVVPFLGGNGSGKKAA